MRKIFQRNRKQMPQGTEAHERDEVHGNTVNQPEQSATGAETGMDAAQNGEETGAPTDEMERLRAELEAQKAEHAVMYDKYVRLHAEFDNFRKRTAKERMELLMSAGADTLKSMLPVLDDMERAVAHNAKVTDLDAVKQGFILIQQKFASILQAHGVKPMESKGQPFDAELQEAISQMPAPTPDLKGKVLDVVETGYTINDKVLRHAKVVVGQ
jgi:molecular chaperone GrpE